MNDKQKAPEIYDLKIIILTSSLKRVNLRRWSSARIFGNQLSKKLLYLHVVVTGEVVGFADSPSKDSLPKGPA